MRHFFKRTFIFTWCLSLISLAFLPVAIAEEVVIVESPNILLSVIHGKPGQASTGIQQYNLKSGETAFIQAVQLRVEPPQTPAEVRTDALYKSNMAKISNDISLKISQIQSKQREIDTENYIVQRAPLENQKRALQDELLVLQNQRDQIESQRTVQEATKPVPPPPPPPIIARGINIKVRVEGVTAILEIVNTDQVQTTIEAPLNQWVQVYGSDQGEGEIWAKVETLP